MLRLFFSVRVLLGVLGVAGFSVSCAMPGDPALTVPREGKPLDNRVAVVYSKKYGIRLAGLEKLHPFDIGKYHKIYDALRQDGLLKDEDVYVPAPLTDAQVRTVHTEGFLQSLGSSRTVATYLEAPALKGVPHFLMKRGVLNPLRKGAGGTLVAAECALKFGVGINIAGGYHHAKPDAGEGFCVFADIPITIQLLREAGKIKRVLVVDLDVHQGNGTVVCLKDDPESYTFSIHQKEIYPVPKEKGDRDVEIGHGTTDEVYLKLLRKHLPEVFAASKPDMVFIVAGCDTLAGDPLATCAMTPEGVARRDLITVKECLKRKVPVVVTLGGGYSAEAWRTQYLSLKGIIEEAKKGTD